jgi:DNA mismatch repair protein MutS2
MIYPENFESKIGFDTIRNMLSEKCLGDKGREYVENISFFSDPKTLGILLKEVEEFQYLLKYEESFPFENYFDISVSLAKIRIEGTFPEIRELFDLKRSLESVRGILNFFKSKEESRYKELKKICLTISNYPFVIDAIERIIDKYGNIKDNASQKLKEIRSEIASKNTQVSRKLSSILKQAQKDGLVDIDSSVSVRNGRGVIPLNVSDKRKIKGLVHDHSATGKTVYIEPEEIVELNNQIVELEYEERREIVKILIKFANDIRPYIDDLIKSHEFLGKIDYIRAKALMGNELGSIMPILENNPVISWRKAVHPLLYLSFKRTQGRKVVPLDIELDTKNRLLVISGPNAGGKSVCLKTVGLLQYMLQCGMTIPVEEGSRTGLFSDILIDIGDEQSIENDLSTYSSHLINMKNFIKYGSHKSLVLIDEFGTGTEPMIGGAIAEALLGELNNMGVFGVITTHYTNLKHYASTTEGIINGAMEFDNHLMLPLFKLSIGKPGSSFAFEIAKKIGLPENILNIASTKAGVKNVNYDKALKDIARDKRYWENKRQNIRQNEKRLDELIEQYEKELSGTKNLKKEIIAKAKEEANNLLVESNRVIENTIRQIKESQAEKEKTREVRKEIEEFKNIVAENTSLHDQDIEDKMERLKARAERIKNRKKDKSQQPSDKITKHVAKTIQVGDHVRMFDTQAVGEVAEIRDGIAHVDAGSFRFYVKIEKLERISSTEYRKSLKGSSKYIPTDPLISERKMKFKPELDIRGERAEDAIIKVQNFIDDAILVQQRTLRIVHGKGNGILRELVRQYLSTVNIIKSFQDEHVEMGGSGVTSVELDF